MTTPYGRTLKAARRRAGKTLANLADYLGVTAAYISDVERGNRGPMTDDRSVQAAMLLEIDPDELLTTAAETRGFATLDLENASPQAVSLGAAFARKWPGVAASDQHMATLRAYLDKLTEDESDGTDWYSG